MGNTIKAQQIKSRQSLLFEIIAENGNEQQFRRQLDRYPMLVNKMRGPGKGMTPLIAAVMKDQREKVEILLNLGASPEGRGLCGATALHYSCLEGHILITRRLLNSGGSADTTDNEGQAALHYAALCTKLTGPETVSTILQTCATLHGMDRFGRTALHLACLAHNMKSAEILLDFGVDVMVRDRGGKIASQCISNEYIFKDFEASGAYQRALQRQRRKAFVIVLNQPSFALGLQKVKHQKAKHPPASLTGPSSKPSRAPLSKASDGCDGLFASTTALVPHIPVPTCTYADADSADHLVLKAAGTVYVVVFSMPELCARICEFL
jgi:hypothetical protein